MTLDDASEELSFKRSAPGDSCNSPSFTRAHAHEHDEGSEYSADSVKRGFNLCVDVGPVGHNLSPKCIAAVEKEDPALSPLCWR